MPPHAFTFVAINRPGEGNPIPESERERARQIRTIGYAGLRRALAAGLPIGFATDAQVVPHTPNAKEFSERVKLGEPPWPLSSPPPRSTPRSWGGRIE